MIVEIPVLSLCFLVLPLIHLILNRNFSTKFFTFVTFPLLLYYVERYSMITLCLQ